MWPGLLVRIKEELWGWAGQGQAEARVPTGTVRPVAVLQSPAAHLQAVQPCSGCPDPTEVHGAPQTGSPAPASPPAAHWRLCLRWNWLFLSAPLDYLLSAGLPHGKVPLPGGDICLAQAGKALHSPVCPFPPPQVHVLWWQSQCALCTISKG